MLFVFYLNTGKANFSVGYFQMKPSFIEEMEEIVHKDRGLKIQYHSLLPKGSVKDKRRFRLSNLLTLSGQLRYLSLFIDVVKQKTIKMNFNNNEEKLRYWATLYNSGMNLSSEEVKQQQSVRQFPYFLKNYNYSEISVEFYDKIETMGW